jgi:hypothetical protein
MWGYSLEYFLTNPYPEILISFTSAKDSSWEKRYPGQIDEFQIIFDYWKLINCSLIFSFFFLIRL